VRLVDLLGALRGLPGRHARTNSVISKHTEFVHCDPEALHPPLVIELDDLSHDRQDRRDRGGALVHPPLALTHILHVVLSGQRYPDAPDWCLGATSESSARTPASPIGRQRSPAPGHARLWIDLQKNC
jgi:hypothetical protein